MFTGASQTLRTSGIDDDLNASGHYEAIRPRARALNRATEGAEIRRLTATPEFVVASVAAITESGTLFMVSATGSQLPSLAGGAAQAILVVGAQKIVPDFESAMKRIEEYALRLETERTLREYRQPSAVGKILILAREGFGPRTTVLLLRETAGF